MPIDLPGESEVGGDALNKHKAVTNGALAKVTKSGAPEPIRESRCHVCMSPHRQFIEGLLIKGANYVWISDNVPGADNSKIDRRSVSNHAKKHMGYQDAAIRAILEEEANLAAQNYEDGVKGAITHRGVLEVALRRAYDDIVSGVTTVEARDLISIITTIQKMDEQADQVAVNQLRAQVQGFVEAIKAETNPETWDRIFRRFKTIMNEDGISGELEPPDAQVID